MQEEEEEEEDDEQEQDREEQERKKPRRKEKNALPKKSAAVPITGRVEKPLFAFTALAAARMERPFADWLHPPFALGPSSRRFASARSIWGGSFCSGLEVNSNPYCFHPCVRARSLCGRTAVHRGTPFC